MRTTTELELKGDYTLEIAETSIHREEVVTKGQDVTLTVPLVKGALQRPQAHWFFQGQAIKESEKVSVPACIDYQQFRGQSLEPQDGKFWSQICIKSE